eukprot:1201905-Lingulodinium_polyedra.AAC.1
MPRDSRRGITESDPTPRRVKETWGLRNNSRSVQKRGRRGQRAGGRQPPLQTRNYLNRGTTLPNLVA